MTKEDSIERIKRIVLRDCVQDVIQRVGYRGRVTIRITKRRGHAHGGGTQDGAVEAAISVPLWTYEQGLDFVRYYACHEIAHLLAGRHGAPGFKETEARLCAIFGIKLRFKCGTDPYPVMVVGANGVNIKLEGAWELITA